MEIYKQVILHKLAGTQNTLPEKVVGACMIAISEILR